MLIYILRHGEAVDAEEAGGDEPRRLTSEGEEMVRRGAVAMHRMRIEPEVIWTSPFLRALETAQITARELGLEQLVEILGELKPGANPEEILGIIQNRTTGGSVMIVGHNPDLELLADFLVGPPGGVRLKKGGMALIRAERPLKRGCGKLLKLWTPKFLAKFAG